MSDTPFRQIQKAAEKEFARMGAKRVDNTHGALDLHMLVTWPDGKVAELKVEWVSLPHDRSLSGGDDGG